MITLSLDPIVGVYLCRISGRFLLRIESSFNVLIALSIFVFAILSQSLSSFQEALVRSQPNSVKVLNLLRFRAASDVNR